MAFLSVIIAAHNAEKTLSATLESLREAIDSCEDIEVIIFNDDSQDATQGIINTWENKLPQVITRQVSYRNVGQVRNNAISLATGKYITMLDSDDLMKPHSLRDATEFLKAQKPDILLTRLLEIRDIRKISSIWHGFNPIQLSTNNAVRRFLLHKDFQAHLIGQFILRELYNSNPIPSMECYEDFAVFPKILTQANKIFYQHQGHYYYIKHNDSLSSILNVSKITSLIECTLQMEKTFPHQFRHLINCHWFDIYINHKRYLSDEQLHIVKQRVNDLYSFSFYLSRDVRFSYKKRVTEALWKK